MSKNSARRRVTMRTRLGIFAGIGGMLIALFASVGVLSASADTAPQVTLCHATDSKTNPYVVITVDQSAVFNNGVVPNGHGTHTGPIFPDTAGQPPKWGDIIPAFDGYGGLNDTAQGQAILANGCKIPPPPTTPTTPTTQPAPPETAPKAPAPQAPSAPTPVTAAARFTG
jgi:hypothetical protein